MKTLKIMMNSWEPSGSIKEKKEKERGYFAHLSRHERLDINNELLGIIWEHEIIIIIKKEKVRGDISQFGGKCILFGCSHNPTSYKGCQIVKKKESKLDRYLCFVI